MKKILYLVVDYPATSETYIKVEIDSGFALAQRSDMRRQESQLADLWERV